VRMGVVDGGLNGRIVYKIVYKIVGEGWEEQ
jgi:hypothetical protein